MGSFPFLSSFSDLQLPEKVSVFAHGLFLLLFLLFASARKIFSFDGILVNGESGGGIRKVVSSYWYKICISCCFFVLLMQVGALGYGSVRLFWLDGGLRDYSVIYLPLVQSLSWVVLSLSVYHCKFKALVRFPLLVRLWWVVSFCLCVFVGYFDTRGLSDRSCSVNSHLILNYVSVPPLAFLCVVALWGITGIELYRDQGNLKEPLLAEEEEPGCLKVTPYSEAGLFSLATLSWLNPLLAIGAKRPLELRDIPLLAPKDRAKTCYKILNSNWERLKAENPSKQPSLVLAIFRSFWKEAALNAVFAGLNTLVSYVGPYLISDFVDYLGGNISYHHEGYVLAGVFFGAKLIETFTSRQWYVGVDILGMHVRSALTAMVFRKGLRLSSSARQCHTSGEIVNYMAVDVQRVGDYSWYLLEY